MADVKRVLSIDVDDRAFKKLTHEWNQWQKSLTHTLTQFQKLATLMKGMRMPVPAIPQNVVNQHARIAHHAKETHGWWEKTKHHIRESIKLQTLGIVGSVIGIGGFLGFGRLAERAAETRRAHMGLGTTYGEQKAFQNVFQHYVSAADVLRGVSTGLADIRSEEHVALTAGLGVNIRGKTTGQVGKEATLAVMRAAKRMSTDEYGAWLEYTGAGRLGFSVEDMRRLRETDEGEVTKKYEDARKKTEVDAKTTKVWEKLVGAWEKAATVIESKLIIALAGMAKWITKATEKFTDLVVSFIEGDTLRDTIKWLERQFEKFTQWLATDAKKDIQEAWGEVVRFGNAVRAFANFLTTGWMGKQLGFIESKEVYGPLQTGRAPPRREESPNERHYQGRLAEWERAQGIAHGAPRDRIDTPVEGRQHGGAVGAGQTVMVGEKGPEVVTFGQSGRVMTLEDFKARLFGLESGGRYGVVNRTSGALGKYQVMPFNVGPWSREALGRTMNPQEFLHDAKAQDAIADFKIRQYYAKFGNWEDVASMWHSGMPLAEAIRHGAKDVNMTTAAYVQHIMGGPVRRFGGGAASQFAGAAARSQSGSWPSSMLTPHESFVDQLVRAQHVAQGINLDIQPMPGAHVVIGAAMVGPGRRLFA